MGGGRCSGGGHEGAACQGQSNRPAAPAVGDLLHLHLPSCLSPTRSGLPVSAPLRPLFRPPPPDPRSLPCCPAGLPDLPRPHLRQPVHPFLVLAVALQRVLQLPLQLRLVVPHVLCVLVLSLKLVLQAAVGPATKPPSQRPRRGRPKLATAPCHTHAMLAGGMHVSRALCVYMPQGAGCVCLPPCTSCKKGVDGVHSTPSTKLLTCRKSTLWILNMQQAAGACI